MPFEMTRKEVADLFRDLAKGIESGFQKDRDQVVDTILHRVPECWDDESGGKELS